ncbi:MAG: hypothetical protein IIC21_01685 [Chloroflexi bacterium]|nr:hypothetical protein [Chloroflexota bacterium]
MTAKALNTIPSARELTNTLPPPGTPCTVGISGARGACPLGFTFEDTWDIDAEGRSNYPICQPAAVVLSPVLDNILSGRDMDAMAECLCPFNDCRLTFVVHAPKVIDERYRTEKARR